MHRTSSSLLSACCKCSVTGTEIVTGNLSLLTPAHAVLYLSTHASSVLYYMPSYLAPPLRAHQGQTAGAERNISLGRMLYRRLCWGVTCVIWFLIMYGGRSLYSITFSCCLCICLSNINVMGSLSYCFVVVLTCI